MSKNEQRMYPKRIHHAEARRLLRDGQPHRLKVWKMATGEILLYSRAIYQGEHNRRHYTRVLLLPSGEIREFCNYTLFEIDDMKIYL